MKRLLLRMQMEYGLAMMRYEHWRGRFCSERYVRGINIAVRASWAYHGKAPRPPFASPAEPDHA